MRRPGGYLSGVDPTGSTPPECDTFTCGHCQRITFVKPLCDPADMGGLCKVCMGLICSNCVGKDCAPWEKQMEIAEARDRALRSYGM
jgi:hypothetical protein